MTIPCSSCRSPMACCDVNFCSEDAKFAPLTQPRVTKVEFKVRYIRLEAPTDVLTATFSNLEDAQLWWDSIRYLHRIYQPIGLRP